MGELARYTSLKNKTMGYYGVIRCVTHKDYGALSRFSMTSHAVTPP